MGATTAATTTHSSLSEYSKDFKYAACTPLHTTETPQRDTLR